MLILKLPKCKLHDIVPVADTSLLLHYVHLLHIVHAGCFTASPRGQHHIHSSIVSMTEIIQPQHYTHSYCCHGYVNTLVFVAVVVDACRVGIAHLCGRQRRCIHKVHSGCCVGPPPLPGAHPQQGPHNGVPPYQLLRSSLIEGDRHSGACAWQHLDQGVIVRLWG